LAITRVAPFSPAWQALFPAVVLHKSRNINQIGMLPISGQNAAMRFQRRLFLGTLGLESVAKMR
jgi:hypothetical protein